MQESADRGSLLQRLLAWPAAHVLDVAHLYRLALEKAEAGMEPHWACSPHGSREHVLFPSLNAEGETMNKTMGTGQVFRVKPVERSS